MSKYIHLTLVLLIIAGLSGLVLGATNEFTKEAIIQVKLNKINDNMSEWFSSVPKENKKENATADDYNTKDAEDVNAVYEAKDKSDNIVGYVLEVKAPGSYGGGMVLLVGIDTEGIVTGYTYVAFNESGPGGDVRSNQGFIDSIVGQTSVSDVDTVSGATFTSNATLNGVQIALDYYNENIKE